MKTHGVKITPGSSGYGYKILLDDMDVAAFVRSLTIEMSATKQPIITLQLVSQSVEIPEEIKMILDTTERQ